MYSQNHQIKKDKKTKSNHDKTKYSNHKWWQKSYLNT